MIKRIVAATVSLCVLASCMPGPTNPFVRRTIFNIHPQAAANWPVVEAVRFFSGLSGSTESFGPCEPDAKCVTVYETRSPLPCGEGAAGCTDNVRMDWTPRDMVVWLVDGPFAPSLKDRIVKHELGHVYGIADHNPSCEFLMYFATNCPDGTPVPVRFSEAELAVIRVN